MYEYEEKEDTSWSFAIGLFIGAAAGAAIATLFTPRSGPQNREAVIETGLVLKDRVANTANSVTHSVKETTSGAVSSVKETTNTAVSSVKETTNTAVHKVSDTVSTVKDKASSAAATVTDAASTTVGKLQDVASTTVEKVQDVASTTVEKVQDVASTATDKARTLTGQNLATETGVELPTGASYDAEDVRPVAPTTVESTYIAQSEAGTSAIGQAVVAASTVPPPAPSIEPAGTSRINEPPAELLSDEQFEVTEMPSTPQQERTAGDGPRPEGTERSS